MDAVTAEMTGIRTATADGVREETIGTKTVTADEMREEAIGTKTAAVDVRKEEMTGTMTAAAERTESCPRRQCQDLSPVSREVEIHAVVKNNL